MSGEGERVLRLNILSSYIRGICVFVQWGYVLPLGTLALLQSLSRSRGKKCLLLLLRGHLLPDSSSAESNHAVVEDVLKGKQEGSS